MNEDGGTRRGLQKKVWEEILGCDDLLAVQRMTERALRKMN